VGPVLADGLAALPADLGHVGPVLAHGLASLAADLGHVGAVLAHGLSALAADLGHVVPGGRCGFLRVHLDIFIVVGCHDVLHFSIVLGPDGEKFPRRLR